MTLDNLRMKYPITSITHKDLSLCVTAGDHGRFYTSFLTPHGFFNLVHLTQCTDAILNLDFVYFPNIFPIYKQAYIKVLYFFILKFIVKVIR